MSLFRIVYVSDAVGAAADNLLALIDIIGVSDRNNRRDQLTGVMMRCDGRFFQAIEGRRVDLDRLMNRLRADPRHVGMRILSDRRIVERLFPASAMAQVDGSPALKRLLACAPDDPEIEARIDRLLGDVSRALIVA